MADAPVEKKDDGFPVENIVLMCIGLLMLARAFENGLGGLTDAFKINRLFDKNTDSTQTEVVDGSNTRVTNSRPVNGANTATDGQIITIGENTSLINQGAQLQGVDNNGDGIIDEYVYIDGLESVKSDQAYALFKEQPSIKTLILLLKTSPATRWIFTLLSFVLWGIYLFAAALAVWIFYFKKKESKIVSEAEEKELAEKKKIAEQASHDPLVGVDPMVARWEAIKKRIYDDNPEGWKISILEADVILEEILDASGYRGQSLGEKLKQVDREDLNSLEDAWEAHKIRNAIAHEGDAFKITHTEAHRALKLFERVFKEFEFI